MKKQSNKKTTVLSLLLATALILTGCAGAGDVNNTTSALSPSPSAGSSSNSSTSQNDPEPTHAADPEEHASTVTGDFVISGNDSGVAANGNEYIISEAGEYLLSGNLEGNIIVKAADSDEITLVLNSLSVSSADAAPIYIESAGKVTIKAEADSYNVIKDLRPAKESDSEETTASTAAGAITAKCDLTVSGDGALVVYAGYNNGIHTSKDLTVKKLSLKVTAVNNALKGKDSVEIKSGNLTIISTGGDGIKTENSDLSSKGNQRGSITISGGTIDIYAACDGISAAYDVNISDDPVINIYTASYSEHSGSLSGSGGSELYIVVPSSLYKTDTDYYAYFYNDDSSDGVWCKANYSTMVSGGRNRYYGLLVSMPSGYANAAFCTFSSGTTPSADSYTAISSNGAINTEMNAYLISTISSGKISGDWTRLSSGQNSGNSDKTSYSSKGIKAYNSVTIDGGSITVYAKDDGIHANSDELLENGSKGTGKVTINGGSVVITASDDGIHADTELTINDGYVHVIKAYEGLEGNLITISGGNCIIYATDDGINAGNGSTTPCITITGGNVDVTTAAGDTDGIDSNGYYKQSGGFVVIKGGSSQGNVAGSLDTDRGVEVTGGSIIAFGGICETPENSINGYASSGTSFSAGSYTLTDSKGNEILSVILSSNYSSVWVASDKLITNTAYTLNNSSGTAVLSWTQTAGMMGASSGGFGGGGFGGGGFGGSGGFRPGDR